MGASEAYERIKWRGVTLNRRTAAALEWVEKQSGVTLSPAQGSYNAGGVSASGGTHDGGGAIDLRVRSYSRGQRVKVTRSLKKAGFAAWYRPEVPGLWGPHIHAILLGDREASSAAKAQMDSYRRGRNGLANDGVDSTWRPDPLPRFSYRKNRPVT